MAAESRRVRGRGGYGPAGNECEREELEWWRECQYVRPSERSLAFVRHLFGDPQASFTRGYRPLPAPTHLSEGAGTWRWRPPRVRTHRRHTPALHALVRETLALVDDGSLTVLARAYTDRRAPPIRNLRR